jgi:indolepyruvate decarboxylase
MTPHNVAAETERLIEAALYHRRPVYMAFPSDLANQPVLDSAAALDQPASDPAKLEAALDAVVAELSDATTACILPGVLVARLGLRDSLQRLVNASGLPFATMFADKSVLDEQQPGYVGMYNGTLMDDDVRQFVESSDRVLAVGTLKTDFNTDAFTARIDPAKLVRVGHHQTEVGGRVFTDVQMADVLPALTRRLPARVLTMPVRAGTLGEPIGENDQPVTADALYPGGSDSSRRTTS